MANPRALLPFELAMTPFVVPGLAVNFTDGSLTPPPPRLPPPRLTVLVPTPRVTMPEEPAAPEVSVDGPVIVQPVNEALLLSESCVMVTPLLITGLLIGPLRTVPVVLNWAVSGAIGGPGGIQLVPLPQSVPLLAQV